MVIKIYADGASLPHMRVLQQDPMISGFTTNPTLMRKSGVTDYELWAKSVVAEIARPISFEVISDDFIEMEMQAHRIASWGANVYCKIPIMNTKGESSIPLIHKLACAGIKLNVTAVFTEKQVMSALVALTGPTPAILSIFAGRIADTGVDPMEICERAAFLCPPNVEILWASTRELLNIKEAEDCGVDIITVPNEMLAKLHLFGKDLHEYSRETVAMFYNDAVASGFSL